MAEKKVKIISERVATPFKKAKEEVKEEEEAEEEETLEEEVIPEETEEDFTDFSSEVVTPTLEPAPTSDTGIDLEEEMEDVPSTPTATTEAIVDYEPSVYNMPDYSAGYEEAVVPAGRETEDRGIMIRPEDIETGREIRQRVEMEELPEIRQARQTGSRTPEDVVVGVEERNTKERMPWEYKEKRRQVK